MSKLLVIILSSFVVISCTAPVIIKRKIRIDRTEKGFTIRLVKNKYRVDRGNKVVIAVIDTGFSIKYKDQVRLCKKGHKDFTADKNPLIDRHSHGTHIAGLIAKNIKVDYCIIVIKYYSPDGPGYDNLINSNKAFRWAIDQGVDMINYSGGGLDSSESEKALIEKALDKNIVVVTAAGNEGKNFKDQTYYPAMYDSRIVVVGNLHTNDEGIVERNPSSNFGSEVDVQVFGTKIKSVNGIKMTGTSQSTAIVTGRIAKHVKNYRLTETIRKYNNQGRDNYYSPLYKFMR